MVEISNAFDLISCYRFYIPSISFEIFILDFPLNSKTTPPNKHENSEYEIEWNQKNFNEYLHIHSTEMLQTMLLLLNRTISTIIFVYLFDCGRKEKKKWKRNSRRHLMRSGDTVKPEARQLNETVTIIHLLALNLLLHQWA